MTAIAKYNPTRWHRFFALLASLLAAPSFAQLTTEPQRSKGPERRLDFFAADPYVQVSSFFDEETLGRCNDNLIASDENGDKQISHDEFASFIGLQSHGQVSGLFRHLPVSFVMVFYTAACSICFSKTGDDSCCVGSKAHIPIPSEERDKPPEYIILLDYLCPNVDEFLAPLITTEPPTVRPTPTSTDRPSAPPMTASPSISPTKSEDELPSASPSSRATNEPTLGPSTSPTMRTTLPPTQQPNTAPTLLPSVSPSIATTKEPSRKPTGAPSFARTQAPITNVPTSNPTTEPTADPTVEPTAKPAPEPTTEPTVDPTPEPTNLPTVQPSPRPTNAPLDLLTLRPVAARTPSPTIAPTQVPTTGPTTSPTVNPSPRPTVRPTGIPSRSPSMKPTDSPTGAPTSPPTLRPTVVPTSNPTLAPSQAPTLAPTRAPTSTPTLRPSAQPTRSLTSTPTSTPTLRPTVLPTRVPTIAPTSNPTLSPIIAPTPRPLDLQCVSFAYTLQNTTGFTADEIFNEVDNTIKDRLLAATRTVAIEILNNTQPLIQSQNRANLNRSRQRALVSREPQNEAFRLAIIGEFGSAADSEVAVEQANQSFLPWQPVARYTMPTNRLRQRRLAFFSDEFPVEITSILDSMFCATPTQECVVVSTTVCVVLEVIDDPDVVKTNLIHGFRESIDGGGFNDIIPRGVARRFRALL